jgi:predicted amidophosphoribosyltransferase
MCRAVAERGLAASVVTWVPGRGADVRRRGFDHAEVLARSVATLLGLPVARCLERSGRTLDQAGLSATERWHNLEGAFVAGSAVSRPVVVDDVVTTGATIRSCALALVAGGAEHVDALVACCA